MRLSQFRKQVDELLKRQASLILILIVHNVVVFSLLFRPGDLGIQQHPPEILDLQKPIIVAISKAGIEDENVKQLLASLLQLGRLIYDFDGLGCLFPCRVHYYYNYLKSKS